MSEDDLVVRMLRDIRTKLDEHDKRFDAVDKRFDAVDKRFDAVDKRFEAVDAQFARVGVETRSIKAAVSKNTVLLEATMEIVAQLKAGRTVTDVSIRHHEAELQEIRERLAVLEERT